MSGRPDGNRQDNRQRGNAAQLLEKYKALARDMQLAGDRVQTEYYLQFADHYFRVLEEGRSRFEEQNQRNRRPDEDDDGEDERSGPDSEASEDDGDEQRPAPRRERNEPRGDRQQRGDRPDRNGRPERFDRGDRPARGDQVDRNDRPESNDRPERAERAEQPSGQDRGERSDQVQRSDRGERGERPVRPRRDAPVAAEGDERISLGVLPPAIGVSNDDGEVEAPRPRRRVRKPREESGPEDIAPAA